MIKLLKSLFAIGALLTGLFLIGLYSWWTGKSIDVQDDYGY